MLQDQQPQPRHLQVGWAVPAVTEVSTAPTRWEYLRIETRANEERERVSTQGETDLHDLPIEDALERLGQSHWELVSITPRVANTFLYTFKRPVAHP